MLRNLILLLLCFWNFTSYANNDCANAIALTPGTSCSNTTGTFSGATLTGAAPSCASESLQDVWYKFTATDVTYGIYLNAVTGLNHGMEIRQGGCNGTVVACRNDHFAGTGESYFDNNFIVGQEYYIRVFNATAQFTAASFTICVIQFPTPANDLCANATQLTPGTTCNNTSGTFSGTQKEGGAPSCAPGASQDVWYKFTATDPTMSVVLSDSQYLNHGFEIYEDGCNGTLVTCRNNNGDGISENYFNNNFTVGQEYYIRVFNAASALSTRSFNICVRSYPNQGNDLCENAIQLTPGTTCAYTTGTFSGTLKDGGVPSCATGASQDVWYKFIATYASMRVLLSDNQYLNHGFEIYQDGCNGTLLTCTNFYQEGPAESYFSANFIVGQEYFIRVFNASNEPTTRSFNICVTGVPPPPNDLCANASEIIPGTGCTYIGANFSGAALDGPTLACPSSVSLVQDVWFMFTATEQTYSIYMNPQSGFNPGFQIFEGSCTGTMVGCVNTNGNNLSEYYQNNNFVIGQTYYMRFFHAMGGYSTQNISFCITKYPKPANDTCQNATLLIQNATCSQVAATLSGAVANGTAASCAQQAGQDVWFRFIAEGSSASVYVGPVSGNDLGLEVVQGGCNGTILGCFNSATANLSETGTITNLTQGTEYYVRVFNVSQSVSISNFTICVYGTIQPCNASVSIAASATQICVGDPVTFTATPVNGGGAPQYQWKVNGNNVGTNSPVFTTTTLADGAVVTCVMTSSVLCPTVPTVISDALTMTVTDPVTPSFTQVAGICPGGSFTLPTTSNNGITGTWSPAVNNTATNTYMFSPDAGQCASTATMTITVNSNVTPTFTQIGPICPGEPFTLPTTSINGVAGTWSPMVNNTVTTTYTFTPAAGQCASAATMTITVNDSVTPVFSQVAAICQGGSFSLPMTSTNGVSGTWSPAVNNNATTTYTFTPETGQCATTATMTVTVNGSVTPIFSQVAAICQEGSFTLPTTSANGVSGTWSPAVNNTATTTYTFTPDAGQCAATATMVVVVNSIDTGVTTTGSTITAAATGATYQWISCDDDQFINEATNASFNATVDGSYAVIVTHNGCSATSECVTIINLATDTSIQKGWKVYPNPAADQLFIETTEATDIVITDMTGKIISSQALRSGINIIGTGSLSAGMYFIKSSSAAHVKFIKQ